MVPAIDRVCASLRVRREIPRRISVTSIVVLVSGVLALALMMTSRAGEPPSRGFGLAPDLSHALENFGGDGKGQAKWIIEHLPSRVTSLRARTFESTRREQTSPDIQRRKGAIVVETFAEDAMGGCLYTNAVFLPALPGLSQPQNESPAVYRVPMPQWEILEELASNAAKRVFVGSPMSTAPTLVVVSYSMGDEWRVSATFEPWQVFDRNTGAAEVRAHNLRLMLFLTAAYTTGGPECLSSIRFQTRNAMIGPMEGMLLDKIHSAPGGVSEAWKKLFPTDFERTE